MRVVHGVVFSGDTDEEQEDEDAGNNEGEDAHYSVCAYFWPDVNECGGCDDARCGNKRE